MPELPEVETTRRGLEAPLLGRTVTGCRIRQRRLRQEVPQLSSRLTGQTLLSLERRAKYLLFRFATGHLLVHLGMSGSLRIVSAGEAAGKHDHIDVRWDDGRILRYRDPRRFGLWDWLPSDPSRSPLLRHLGPEPLSPDFDGVTLYANSRGRRTAVKNYLMDGRIVVGVGNIYASEALFAAGIRPGRAAGRVRKWEYLRLAEEVRRILSEAIDRGGTTLQDFVGGDGEPGYFAQDLRVYGRADEACTVCQSRIRQKQIGQRSSFFCPNCQV